MFYFRWVNGHSLIRYVSGSRGPVPRASGAAGPGGGPPGSILHSNFLLVVTVVKSYCLILIFFPRATTHNLPSGPEGDADEQPQIMTLAFPSCHLQRPCL